MRRWRRRCGSSFTALALLAATAVPGGAAPAPGADQETKAAGASSIADRTVTLVTGDRVRLRGSEPPVTDPGPGRSGMQFGSYQENGDTYVIPSDAAPLLSTGRLDRRLVT